MTVGTDQQTLDELCVNTIRTLSMDAVQQANSGHPGTPMALAPIAYLLYTRVMKHNPQDPHWPGRDRFVLSCGHASMLLYSILHLTGYDVTLDQIKQLPPDRLAVRGPSRVRPRARRGDHHRPARPGHLHRRRHGARRAHAGRALQQGRPHPGRLTTRTSSPPTAISRRASPAEASSLAGHLGLGRLVGFYDDNHITIEGDTELAFSEDVGARYEAYGWHVQNLRRGPRRSTSSTPPSTAAQEVTDRPSLIIVRTHIAPGSPNKQDTHGAHGSPLGEEEIRLTKEVYGCPSLEPFFIPDEALAHFREARDRGRAQQRRLGGGVRGLPRGVRGRGRGARAPAGRALPAGFGRRRAEEGPGRGHDRHPQGLQEVIQWAAAEVPELVGGSADLAPSTLTLIDGGGSVEAGRVRRAQPALRHPRARHGRDGQRPGADGLPRVRRRLPDLQRLHGGSIRLAAMMRIPSTFVFTHDSIGLGEDGPTHQPIEQLVTLRATPNLDVVRPAGFNETALAWRHALRQTDRPTALALSRQGLPVWDPAAVPDDAIERGAYVLRDTEGGDPEIILMGSGSEVHLAHDAAKLLEADGIRVRLVSMPCLDRFAEQDEAYRDEVLPPAVRARVAVEAASPIGWHRWVGDHGDVVAMEGFGASAPGEGRCTSTSGSPARRSPSAPARSSKEEHERPHVNERLAALTAAGTSVWLDQIRRGMIESGELARMVDEDSLRGVTSNPAIFEKAILGSRRLRRGHARGGEGGPLRARGLPPPRRPRRPARRRRAAARLRADRRARRLRLARGRAAPRARHRRARSSRRACTGASSTART